MKKGLLYPHNVNEFVNKATYNLYSIVHTLKLMKKSTRKYDN